MRRVVLLAAWMAFGAGGPVSAVSAQTRESLRGLVGDVRLLSTTLPTGAGWTPPSLTTGMLVPSRGLGGEAAVHALLGPGTYRRLSLGASALFAEGRATGEEAESGEVLDTVVTRMTAVAPHLGVNFGHRLGWSYLSLGAGLASVRSNVQGSAAEPADWGTVFHYGGGARWFLGDHVAVSLDLRFWALTPRAATPTLGRAAATTRVALGAGVSFR